MIDTPQTPTRDEARVAHNRAFTAMIRRVLRLARDENLAYYTDLAGPTPETGRALACAIAVSDGEMMALADLLFDALHPEPPFAPASRDPQLAALEQQVATLRAQFAVMRTETEKWRSESDRKHAQLGGRTIAAAGIAAAHDHEGD